MIVLTLSLCGRCLLVIIIIILFFACLHVPFLHGVKGIMQSHNMYSMTSDMTHISAHKALAAKTLISVLLAALHMSVDYTLYGLIDIECAWPTTLSGMWQFM